MAKLTRSYSINRTLIFVHDLAWLVFAWSMAYWLRFNLEDIPHGYRLSLLKTLPVMVAAQVPAFLYFKIYRGLWRYTSVTDVLRLVKAVVVGSAAGMAILFLYDRLEGVPRSVLPVYTVLFLMGVLGSRILYRAVKDGSFSARTGSRILIIGAGGAGGLIVRDLLGDLSSNLLPVGFVDDDSSKQGKELHGLRVLGKIDDIPAIVEKWDIEMAIVAIPSASSAQMRRIVENLEKSYCEFRALPPLKDLVSGRVNLAQTRQVRIEDLLGREQVRIDSDRIAEGIAGKVVLVTGGGGSIGSELCRQIMLHKPKRLLMLDHSEFALYRVLGELERAHGRDRLIPVLGDVTDSVTMEGLFGSCRPDIVFHAAAYKHVPMVEENVRAGIYNNILGTRCVAETAMRHNVSHFVLVSTDKAVNSTNVMGASKRVAELLCQKLNDAGQTRFVVVRFGNVLDSAGSVIPLFREQIARGGPVTVTHPDIERYFMTIPEASRLILQADAQGKGGEVFVLDMGEPVKIVYLAEQMIRLSGKEPGTDIEITYVGLRPGEKLYEELFYEQESLQPTSHPKIMKAGHRDDEVDCVDSVITELEAAVKQHADETVLRSLMARYMVTQGANEAVSQE